MKIQSIKPSDYKIHSEEIRTLVDILQPLLADEESDLQLFDQVCDLLSDLDFSHTHSEYAYLSFLTLLFQAIMTQIPANAEIQDQLILLQEEIEPPLDLQTVDTLYRSVQSVAEQLQQVGVLTIEQSSMILNPILLEYSNARKQAQLRKSAAQVSPAEPADNTPDRWSEAEVRRVMGEELNLSNDSSRQTPKKNNLTNDGRRAKTSRKKVDNSNTRRVLGSEEPLQDGRPAQRQSNGQESAEQIIDTLVQSDGQKNYHKLVQGLQKDFIRQTRIAVTQISSFGEQIEMEIDAIKAMTTIDNVEQYRKKVIFTMESLQAQHKQLAENFDTARSYLLVIESGNQQLMDELDRVRLLSLTDELTGLPNRRAFLRRLHYEVSRVKRYRNPITLVILDLDHFKSINDKYGHKGGDEVLKMYTHKVFSLFRHHDSVARYGGEEFVMLFPDTNLVGVLNALNKIQEKCKTMKVTLGDKVFALPSFSAGVVEYQQGESAEHFVARADKELYRAKRGGRSRVEYEKVTTEPDDVVEEKLTELDPNIF